jgi:hypothetical protein
MLLNKRDDLQIGYDSFEIDEHSSKQSTGPSVSAKLLDLLVDLDKGPELPDIKHYTNLEALISPRLTKNGIGNITKFKNIYEDPRKDPRYKYQTSPFREPKNDLERKFDDFLKSIKDDKEEHLSLLKLQTVASVPVMQSVNIAFSPFMTKESTIKDKPVRNSKVGMLTL